jgi:hypothetical protein
MAILARLGSSPSLGVQEKYLRPMRALETRQVIQGVTIQKFSRGRTYETAN